MATEFEKLTEEDLQQLTDEEREGYEQELEAYTQGAGDDDAGDEGDGVDNDTGNGDGGDGDGGETDLDAQLAAQEAAGAPELDLNAAPEGKDGGDAGDDDASGDDDLATFDPLPDLGSQREKIKEQQELKQELAEKFDNGDITAQEKAAQERKIDDEIYSLQSDLMRREHKVETAKEDWQSKVVPDFIAGNSVYKPGSALIKMLNEHVKSLQVGQYASNPFHPNVLKLADRNLRAELGEEIFGEPKPKDPKPDKSGKAAAKRDMPPSLRNVPAAAAEDIAGDGSEFAFLDRLADTDIEKFEEALTKLSPADLDRYMNA
ncbi:hypothetical protein OIV19_21590 [Brucella sp. HL-2]|nr:hypothetical protein [Brucella sp. HL-2]MCV9910192.1 hypothetical protein [Brucella sp. HL-2]